MFTPTSTGSVKCTPGKGRTALVGSPWKELIVAAQAIDT